MDIASKIKAMKEEIQDLDSHLADAEKQIAELKNLIAEKKKKQDKIEALKNLQNELFTLL